MDFDFMARVRCLGTCIFHSIHVIVFFLKPSFAVEGQRIQINIININYNPIWNEFEIMAFDKKVVHYYFDQLL